ncbi:helix-turn-helix transcriptional regulator [Actinacidiphila acidipaludis]|uniref:LuxR family transcriptional regulator n=1 Tax=Actinacidiphila acidipaludis TaxID=2873382 RepID=A0ABS7Q581_9ACTN|nr:LuxR family transcriptional regulator [Streptomyces acidipaludis]MBY8878262.1 LuxR family transcriptional regulator [Streptomyces acidipaludis]
MSGGDASGLTATSALAGRGEDLRRIRRLLGAESGGGALLLSGEAGIGKSAVLDAVAEEAAAQGARVLRASGTEFEADCAYAGLNQILLPLQPAMDAVDQPYQEALRIALGFGSGPPPGKLIVCNATLALLRDAAAHQPVLVVVDDLPWIDTASAAVLGLVARRLAGSGVRLLAAARPGSRSPNEAGALPVYALGSLAKGAAEQVVDARFPGLAGPVRRRVLTAAQGNPLALLELPAALGSAQRASVEDLPAVLPLGRRLEELFGARIAGLPQASRRLLLLAALEGTGDLAVLRTAVRRAGHGDGLHDLEDAERAQLVHVDAATRRLNFRHPLTRSAVVAAATSGERRAAHEVLARTLVDRPEHQAWHLGEAAVEPDEHVAALLERAAGRALERGDAVGGVRTLIRSAALTPRGADRYRRLTEAAYIGAESTGSLLSARSLLDDAHTIDADRRGSLRSAAAVAVLVLNGDGDLDTAHRLLVTALENTPYVPGAEDPARLDALHLLLLICFHGGRAELWRPFRTALGQLGPQVPPALSVAARTFSDPARTGASARGELELLLARLPAETDPAEIARTGTAALYLDRLGDTREAAWRVVRQGRAGGPARRHLAGLMHLCLDDYLVGLWDEARRLADEGARLCDEYGYSFFAWYYVYIQAVLAAVRGEAATCGAAVDRITRWATPRGVHGAVHYAHHAATVAALGQGDFTAAYGHANAISPTGRLASHVPHALWVILDLVEAAVRTERHEQAARHVRAAREAGVAALSPRLAMLVEAAAALCAAEDADAVRLFRRALAVPGVERWSFDVARVRLLLGERLRRSRATTESREPLGSALATFERLGARPWADRARNELRAAGARGPRASAPRTRTLTPQEREIARLAASGLTNKEIAGRLFLSHRTVGAHLYQVFPKLGITSRAMLREALEEDEATPL